MKPSYRDAIKVVRQAKRAQKTARKCRQKLLENPGATYQQKQSWKYHIARAMKLVPTRCEENLREALRKKNQWCVQTQAQVGPYIADFILPNERVIIEVDGAVHETRQAYDLARDKYMAAKGYRVVRISNSEISTDINGAVQKIDGFIKLT